MYFENVNRVHDVQYRSDKTAHADIQRVGEQLLSGYDLGLHIVVESSF